MILSGLDETVLALLNLLTTAKCQFESLEGMEGDMRVELSIYAGLSP